MGCRDMVKWAGSSYKGVPSPLQDQYLFCTVGITAEPSLESTVGGKGRVPGRPWCRASVRCQEIRQ